MSTTENAGISLPETHPEVDALLSATAHLHLAHRALDEQRTNHLDTLPKDRRDRLYDRIGEIMLDIFSQYGECCETLFQILVPTL